MSAASDTMEPMEVSQSCRNESSFVSKFRKGLIFRPTLIAPEIHMPIEKKDFKRHYK